MPVVDEPEGHAVHDATPPVLVLLLWYVPCRHTSHTPLEPRLVAVPALYAVCMKLPAAHDVTVAVVRPVLSAPEHLAETYCVALGVAQLAQVPGPLSSHPLAN